MPKVKICIIGAGASGMTACKACLEEKFDVVVYEKSKATGGLWRYRENSQDDCLTVSRCTVTNSDKEVSAFSDFPPPKEFPNFMHHTQLIKYLDTYAKSFNFENYVKLEHEIIKVEQHSEYDTNGKWVIHVKDLKEGKVFQDIVNAVMVCSGHHGTPLVPNFDNQDEFSGQIIHSSFYKVPEPFEGKKVVVVGIGNSGGDLAVDLGKKADKVYLSTRRGAWIVPRIWPFGYTFGFLLTRFFALFIKYLPVDLVCSSFEFALYTFFNICDCGIEAKHRFFEQPLMVNDVLPQSIRSGSVIVKPNINRFTKNGVVFEGETNETRCDVVLLGTGFKVSFPFLSQSVMNTDSHHVHLYKNAFIPELKHPETLVFITLVQPDGPLMPIGEMQSRWFAQLMANKTKLPEFETMIKDIKCKQNVLKRFYVTERNMVRVYGFINIMDEIAEQFGAKPNLLKYFFTDNKLWRALFFKTAGSYQYRLEGPHSWPGARDAILSIPERWNKHFKLTFN